MQKVTLGGDRLGSGNKNKIALRNYERSTHNLSRKFTSSMQCGVLYPFTVIPAMRGDSFDINVNADARTIPTKGPLFGSFKMQIDYFQYPWRLAQALLHNNPLALGLKMNQVYLPQLAVKCGNGDEALAKMHNTSLLKYLGLSGIGRKGTNYQTSEHVRFINAVPVLAYYEIFKTYYSNKQEQNAYVISASDTEIEENNIIEVFFNDNSLTNIDDWCDISNDGIYTLQITFNNNIELDYFIDTCYFGIADSEITNDENFTIKELLRRNNEKKTNEGLKNCGIAIRIEGQEVYITINTYLFKNAAATISYSSWAIENICVTSSSLPEKTGVATLVLKSFNLQNIDDMRLAILSKHTLGQPFKIADFSALMNVADWNTTSGTDGTGLPYSALFTFSNGKPNNTYPLNGLVVKTYQSDLFNNWVKTEWIDGENGIAAITAISTASGSFTIDTLNLSEKLYNMLNRVAVSDGSYEGWQDAVFTQSPRRHIESPVYLGGSSSEIVFEEIVQTSESTENNPLGSLGGKGKLLKRKGGHITVKVDEASFIIGIVSLTPRINYTQGNEWYLTDLLTMDDIHKPALDGIGFQNLLGEQLAWFDTVIDGNSAIPVSRSVIGKVPAWINYMTRIDQGYGDFAETDGNGFMLLQRNYEKDNNGKIKDATTYIDPQKYNYAFAYRGLDAQNFWIQIYEQVTARRLMSAKQIPNI